MPTPKKYPNLTFYEQFDIINQQKNKKDRIAKLHELSSHELKSLLDYAFNPHIKWLVPEGTPPFTPSKDDQGSLVKSLLRQFKKLSIFLNMGVQYKNLKDVKRQMIFISLLETIHKQDVELLIAIKDKKLPFKNITPELVKEAFPNFTKTWDIKVDGKDNQKTN